jgi:hypothetical protein
LFQEFIAAISTDRAIADQLTKWEQARREWRMQWTGRGATSAEVLFDRLTPRSTSAGSGGWEHPVAEEAAELKTWRTAWQTAAPAERRELATAFVSALALTETHAASSSDAFAELARPATARGLPLVVVTPAFSSLDPERFVVLCDAWLAALGKFGGAPVRGDVASYPELNTRALDWFAAAEGDSVATALAGRPRADRFGVFCTWITHTTAQESTARFDVTQKKYKDWPPMW